MSATPTTAAPLAGKRAAETTATVPREKSATAVKGATSVKSGISATSVKSGTSVVSAKVSVAKQPLAPRPNAQPLGAEIDAYIAGLRDWRSEVVMYLCQLTAESAPRAAGSITWGQPVYKQKGPFLYVKAYPHIVHFGFWRGVKLEDPEKLLVGDGDRMRHIKLWSRADVREERFSAWIREAVKLNQELGDPTKTSQ